MSECFMNIETKKGIIKVYSTYYIHSMDIRFSKTSHDIKDEKRKLENNNM